MRLAVHMAWPVYEGEELARFRARLQPGISITTGPDVPDPAEYHILVAGRPQREFITASPNLRAFVVPWAGIPDSTRDLLLEYPRVAVHNLHHNALPVAEHTFTLFLAAAKFIVPMDRSLRAGDWRPRYRPNPTVLLAGKTALILGYGAIGQKVAGLCQGFGMHVVGVRRRPISAPTDEAGIEMAHLAELASLLPRADALFICLPHTPETTGLIGAEELALLPPHAILVNIGRGPIVDQAALYAALRNGGLYAAGLDVWYNYPPDEESRAHTPPSDYAFHELDNVVMSPHRASHSIETEALRIEHLADLLNAAARGEPLPNRVDLQAGY